MSYRLLLVIALIAFGVLLLIAGVQAGTGVRSLALASPLPPPMTPQAYLPLAINMTPPLSTTTHYVYIPSESYYIALGCDEGQRRRPNQDVTVIFDWGYPASRNGIYGAVTLDPEIFYPVSVITDMMEAYLTSFYVCSAENGAHLTLGIGINNHRTGEVTPQHGTAWVGLVNYLNDWIASHSWQNRLRAYGAIDVEFAWNSYTVTRAWIDAYNQGWRSPSNYLNFGSCDGCPWFDFPNSRPPGDWDYEAAYYVLWWARPAYPLPEIYLTNGGNADQWQRLAEWGVVTSTHHSLMRFQGALTQWAACLKRPEDCHGIYYNTDNTPEQGWYQLWDWLNRSRNTAQSPRWSTDIRWDKDWPTPTPRPLK